MEDEEEDLEDTIERLRTWYLDHPQQFLVDIDRTWKDHEINAYVLVTEDDKMYQVLLRSD